MICDIKSYLPAMYYMKAFNDIQDVITYWDEQLLRGLSRSSIS